MGIPIERRWSREFGLMGLVSGTVGILVVVGDLFDFRSIGFAFLLNWMVMRCVAFTDRLDLYSPLGWLLVRDDGGTRLDEARSLMGQRG